MRIRQNGGLTFDTTPGYLQDYTLDGNGNWQFAQSASWGRNSVNTGFIAQITDDDSKRRGKLRTTRFCDHTTNQYVDGSQKLTYYLDAARTRKRVCYTGGTGYLGELSVPSNLASVHKEALTFFAAGCTKLEFQLGIDLLEWRETVNLVKSLTPKLKSLRNFLTNATHLSAWKAYARSLEISVRELTFKDVANYHLAYSFGVKPLIEDCFALVRSLQGLEAKFSWLREHSGKPVKVRFQKDLSKAFKPSEGVTYRDALETDTLRIRHYACSYKAFATLVYDVSQLNDYELRARVLARSFGLDAVIGMLWESIPYSFVVDWVFRVGDWLDQFDTHISLPYTILDCGWSVNMVEDRMMTYEYSYPLATALQVAWACRRTRYHREPGLPISYADIELGDPGLNQLVLALSLGIQKMHK